MIWIMIALAVIFIIAVCCAAVAIRNAADDQIDSFPREDVIRPRCDVTGQPLTARQQYDRECG